MNLDIVAAVNEGFECAQKIKALVQKYMCTINQLPESKQHDIFMAIKKQDLVGLRAVLFKDNYYLMPVRKLRKLAGLEGIPYYSTMSKEKLIQELLFNAHS